MHELVTMSRRETGAALSPILSAASRPSLGLIGALLASAALIAGCGDAAEAQGGPPQGPPPVSVAPAIQRAVAESEEFSGRVEATELVELRPRVSGAIDKVHFTDGATVRKGDLLFTIDPRPFEAELARAQASRAPIRAGEGRLKADRMDGNAASVSRRDRVTGSCIESSRLIHNDGPPIVSVARISVFPRRVRPGRPESRRCSLRSGARW